MNQKYRIILYTVCCFGTALGTYVLALSVTDENKELSYIVNNDAVVDEALAVSLLLERYPELERYTTQTLPPTRIYSKRSEHGVYIGFAEEGSGLPGVLRAICFLVTDRQKIIQTATYMRESTLNLEDPRSDAFSPETCMYE